MIIMNMTLQKVYIVCYYDWEDTSLIGIYTSYEKALKVFNEKKTIEKEFNEKLNDYRKNYKMLHETKHYGLLEVELNKECSFIY